MTNTDIQMSHPDAPVTRPGFHLTEEGRVVGARLDDVEFEWQGADDSRVQGPGVTTVAGVPVVESESARREAAGLSPNGVDGTPGAPHPNCRNDHKRHTGKGESGGGGPPGAAAPAVTTSVDEDGNKRTVEHEVNIEVSGTAANVLRDAIEEAEETMRKLDRSNI